MRRAQGRRSGESNRCFARTDFCDRKREKQVLRSSLVAQDDKLEQCHPEATPRDLLSTRSPPPNDMMKPLQVGLIGFGTVGKGVFDVLRRNEEEITRRAGRPIRITWIATRTLDRAR